MARRPRLVLPAVPLHIVQRGNNRAPCFADDTDYQVYLSMLLRYANDTACDVHAYVLMTNHVHLLLSARSGTAPSDLMRRLGQHYVQYFNRRHRRTGTLWEGRFRSGLVDHDGYLLICQRYIELNPVRVGIVDDPRHYPWSSYRRNALGADDPLLTMHPVYAELGKQDVERCTAYRRLFGRALPDEQVKQLRTAINSNAPIGTASFIERLTMAVGAPRPRGRPRRLQPGVV